MTHITIMFREFPFEPFLYFGDDHAGLYGMFSGFLIEELRVQERKDSDPVHDGRRSVTRTG
jgi:hypothetical protein